MAELQWRNAWPLHDSRCGSMLQAKVAIGPCTTAQQGVGALANRQGSPPLHEITADPRWLALVPLKLLQQWCRSILNQQCCKASLPATCRTV